MRCPISLQNLHIKVTVDGEPWFVGKDVCKALGDTNYRRSLSNIDDSDKGVSQHGHPYEWR